MVIIEQLSKRYGARTIFRDLSWSAAAGHITALCGDNGAGKTTLLRCIAGLTAPDAGRMHCDDSRYYLGDADHLFQHATVEENLALAAAVTPAAPAQYAALRTLWGVDAWRAAPVRTLSRGQRRRVALCRAWLLQPRWLLLDEPLVALDDAAQACVAQALAWAAAQGTGVIVAVQRVPNVLAPVVHATWTLPAAEAA